MRWPKDDGARRERQAEVFLGGPMDCYLATWWVFEVASDDPQISAWRDHFAPRPASAEARPSRSGRADP